MIRADGVDRGWDSRGPPERVGIAWQPDTTSLEGGDRDAPAGDYSRRNIFR